MSISLNVSSPNAIPDYEALISEVSEWLDRGDELDSRIPTFILMAEAYFNNELRTPQMEQSNTFSVFDEDTPLPTDYLALRAIYQETVPDNPLRAMSPDALRQEYRGQPGTPTSYSIVGGAIRVAPVPEVELIFTMDYFARIQSLSATAPSNWLLEGNPALYLFATLYFAEAYLDNPTRAAQWQALSDDILRRLKTSATAARWGAGTRPSPARQATKGRC
jgi:hypothetical protein